MVMEAIELSIKDDFAERIDVANLTLEHVMPQDWRTHWPLSSSVVDVQEAEHARDDAVKQIGNLTLVTQKLNSRMSNAPWLEKKAELSKIQWSEFE